MNQAWPEGAREFVTTARVAHLSTADRHGAPHCVPICFVLVEDVVYSVVDAKPKRSPLRLKRLRNVAENPQAAVLVDLYDDDWVRLRWVLVRGSAEIVRDEAVYERALAALASKYGQYEGQRFSIDGNPLLAVRAETVTAWSYRR